MIFLLRHACVVFRDCRADADAIADAATMPSTAFMLLFDGFFR